MAEFLHLLPRDVMPEDRSARILWGSQFEDAASEVEKGAVFSGTPYIKRGMLLNGTTDAALYPLYRQLAVHTYFSVQAVFIPHFTYDDGGIHNLFSTDGTAYRLRKNNDGNLQILVGATALTDIDDSTYYTYWRPNEVNVITLALDPAGDNNAWLNGHQVMTAEATPWSANDENFLAVGSTTTPTSFWDGWILMLKFYDSLLTEADNVDLYKARRTFG